VTVPPPGLRGVMVALWILGVLAFAAAPWIPSACPMRLVLHVPCPSCGLTRAARSLLHGDIAGATHLHPLWWVVFPYLGALAALEAWTYVTTGEKGKWTRRPLVQKLGFGILGALVVVWGARELGAFGGPVAI
jgi:hypothetical protein